MADSTGRELTFGRALVGSLLLARAIRQRVPAGSSVGLLLPASVGGALANIAASIAGRTPVNLNFTAGRDAMAAAIDRCGIAYESILIEHQGRLVDYFTAEHPYRKSIKAA